MLPVHIGIIPDGNRRYSKDKNMPLKKVYEKSSRKLYTMIKTYFKKGVKYITVYGLSMDNLKKRSEFDIKTVLEEISEKSKKIKEFEKNIKIKFIGNKNKLPFNIRNLIKNLENKTSKNDSRFLNICIAYNGNDEIIHSVKKTIKKHKELTEENIRKNLYTDYPYPDMIIRTGGEKRLSGFLTFQSQNSELFFIDSKIPEITKKEMLLPLKQFEKIERRLGA